MRIKCLLMVLSIIILWPFLAIGETTKWIPEDYVEALKKAKKRYPYVKEVLKEDPILRQQRLRKLGININKLKKPYIILQSPYVNTYEDKYGPVRFMHSMHAIVLNQNCALCHHYKPKDSSQEILPCRSCHKYPFDVRDMERPGLKAAYHQRCIGCHKEMKRGPTDCNSCHKRKVPDHKNLVKLPPNPTPYQVTKECLRCHKEAGKEMLASAHWLWKGPSTYTVNHLKCVKHGKGTDVLNND